MANIKSQKKRILIAERNNLANSSFKTRMRHAIKKVKVALEAKDLATAEKLLPEAVSLIDKSVKNGIQHSIRACQGIFGYPFGKDGLHDALYII